MERSITVHYLEMTTPAELRPHRTERADVLVIRVGEPWPELNRFFYTAIGGEWFWVDRLGWTRAQWLEHLSLPTTETWVLSVGGLPAGYFELVERPERDVEIAYFGLLDRYIGQGLGGHLLTAAVECAWQRGAKRVWLHTCSLDHPAAMSNYLARGFRKVREEVIRRELPREPPGPWPGAAGSSDLEPEPGPGRSGPAPA